MSVRRHPSLCSLSLVTRAIPAASSRAAVGALSWKMQLHHSSAPSPVPWQVWVLRTGAGMGLGSLSTEVCGSTFWRGYTPRSDLLHPICMSQRLVISSAAVHNLSLAMLLLPPAKL
jgi:hypothetical protein